MVNNLKISKAQIALLATILVAILAWVVFRRYTNSSEQTDMAAVVPVPGFVVSIPQKALINNYVVISVEAPAETNCELTYVSPSGEIRQTEAIANKTGSCVWKWKIEESGGSGAGRLIFTIEGISDTHFMEIHSGF